jgi:hypothetical protein
MHPTADTEAVIYINRSGRRVMLGVRRLMAELKAERFGAESREKNSCLSRAGRG